MISLADIQQAQRRLAGVAYHTPLIPFVQPDFDRTVLLKSEQLQPIGSFKLRGAYNRLASLSPDVLAQGVIAYSSGNHAQGVAYSARRLGTTSIIVMPSNAPSIKIEATRAFGGQVVLYDANTERREDVAQQLMEGHHYTLIPPFNDLDVIAGQGTVGLEIFEDYPAVELVLTPVGGGGLISGVAVALKSLNPAVKIIGVEPALANDAQESFRAGKIVELPAAQVNQTVADGVRTLSLGELTFAHIQAYVDDIVTVSEDEIREAMRRMLLDARLVIEPTAALPLAAYLYHRDELPRTQNIVLTLTGGNVERSFLAELLRDLL